MTVKKKKETETEKRNRINANSYSSQKKEGETPQFQTQSTVSLLHSLVVPSLLFSLPYFLLSVSYFPIAISVSYLLLSRSFASLWFCSAFNQQTTIDGDSETAQFPVDTRYVGGNDMTATTTSVATETKVTGNNCLQ